MKAHRITTSVLATLVTAAVAIAVGLSASASDWAMATSSAAAVAVVAIAYVIAKRWDILSRAHLTTLVVGHLAAFAAYAAITAVFGGDILAMYFVVYIVLVAALLLLRVYGAWQYAESET